jgi:hypothetical protein
MSLLRAAVRADRSPDRVTARATAGVRMAPGHWASRMIHAFRRWDGPLIVTWCDLEVHADGGALTTDRIDCQQCSEASWQAIRRAIN